MTAATTSSMNRRWLYAHKPDGALGVEHFALEHQPVPVPAPGQALLRVRMASVDPAQRAWMMARTYRPQLMPGDFMPAFGIGEVVQSLTPDLKIGDLIEGDLGWQDYALVSPKQVMRRHVRREGTPHPPLEQLVGALSITGLTAYFGLLAVGQPRPGQTVVVSGAGGAVGSVAVQVARIAGCRVVGVAGGEDKCARVVSELGAHAAVDYRRPDFRAALKAACPDGVDVYFDNTAGPILEITLSLMNQRGCVVCCGAVSQYDQGSWGTGVAGVPGVLISRRIRMEGFIVMDFDHQRREAEAALTRWMDSGELKVPVHISEGLAQAPQALVDLLAGRNFGKAAVRVA
jgi:NADPH-dependent curcumin reductase CurA